MHTKKHLRERIALRRPESAKTFILRVKRFKAITSRVSDPTFYGILLVWPNGHTSGCTRSGAAEDGAPAISNAAGETK